MMLLSIWRSLSKTGFESDLLFTPWALSTAACYLFSTSSIASTSACARFYVSSSSLCFFGTSTSSFSAAASYASLIAMSFLFDSSFSFFCLRCSTLIGSTVGRDTPGLGPLMIGSLLILSIGYGVGSSFYAYELNIGKNDLCWTGWIGPCLCWIRRRVFCTAFSWASKL